MREGTTATRIFFEWNDDNSNGDKKYAGKMLYFWIRAGNCADKTIKGLLAATFIITTSEISP